MKAGWICALSLLAMAAGTGCASRRAPVATAPTASVPAVSSIGGSGGGAVAPPLKEDPTAGIEPGLQYERVIVPPLRPGTPVGQETPSDSAQLPPATPPPSGPSRRPAANAGARSPEAETPAEAEAPKATEVRPPSLKPMLSDAERRQLESQISAYLDRARRNLSQIREARLGANERAVLEEARSFAARADQLRGSDPVLANSLAERSAILTQELLRKQ